MACAYESLVRSVHARIRWASRHRRAREAESRAATITADGEVRSGSSGAHSGTSCSLVDAPGELPTVTNVAYTGRAVRELHEGVARMYHLICPEQYVDPAVPAPDVSWGLSAPGGDVRTASGSRIRVGIVCQTLRGHTLTRLLGGVIAKLSTEPAHGVDIVLLSRRAWVGHDAVADALEALVDGRMITLPDNVDLARDVVERQRLDVSCCGAREE